ncbi:2-C-methyl-D-erythritol 4-phosphate cytidylyltransferase 1 [Clostridium sp. CAG:813]|nr:2-C-methyl-D-erythritol 4-phosphate cytidylyltransferase 1 [Clostridium sp. CAG:813]
MVKGNRGNIKITTIEDLYILRALIRYKEDLEAFGEQ